MANIIFILIKYFDFKILQINYLNKNIIDTNNQSNDTNNQSNDTIKKIDDTYDTIKELETKIKTNMIKNYEILKYLWKINELNETDQCIILSLDFIK